MTKILICISASVKRSKEKYLELATIKVYVSFLNQLVKRFKLKILTNLLRKCETKLSGYGLLKNLELVDQFLTNLSKLDSSPHKKNEKRNISIIS